MGMMMMTMTMIMMMTMMTMMTMMMMMMTMMTMYQMIQIVQMMTYIFVVTTHWVSVIVKVKEIQHAKNAKNIRNVSKDLSYQEQPTKPHVLINRTGTNMGIQNLNKGKKKRETKYTASSGVGKSIMRVEMSPTTAITFLGIEKPRSAYCL